MLFLVLFRVFIDDRRLSSFAPCLGLHRWPTFGTRKLSFDSWCKGTKKHCRKQYFSGNLNSVFRNLVKSSLSRASEGSSGNGLHPVISDRSLSVIKKNHFRSFSPMRVCHKSMAHPFRFFSFFQIRNWKNCFYLQQSPNFHKLGLCLSAKDLYLCRKLL